MTLDYVKAQFGRTFVITWAPLVAMYKYLHSILLTIGFPRQVFPPNHTPHNKPFLTKATTLHLFVLIMSGNDNPGNFANRPKEDVQSAAQKGGSASAGGFASMDPDKQVRPLVPTLLFDDPHILFRRTLRPWAAKHPAGRSSLAVRRRRRRDVKAVLHLNVMGNQKRSCVVRSILCSCTRG